MKRKPLFLAILILVFGGLPGFFALAQEGPSRMYGKDHSFTIGELPSGKLKTGLLALSPSAREKAMDWLHTLTFDASDAAGHLRVDPKGGIFIICPDCHGHCDGKSHHSQGSSGIPEPENSHSRPSGQPEEGKASVPVKSPPAYHSKPGAPYHIYLDFNGAIVTGKAWNEGDVASWDCAAWSSDADTTMFSDSEQAEMRRVWERIAEDYAPFDINVTTDAAFDPDTYPGDKNKVGWLLFTPTTDKNNKPCPHNGAGGVAYVGVFGDPGYFNRFQPAWVTPMDAADMAEAGSHEMGHNMGLSHDGTSFLTYYGGHLATASAPSWGPIMGTGYNRNVSQWSKGEYYDANQKQNDLSIISARVPYRTDDHGDSYATATVWSGGLVKENGVVETTGNADFFEFVTGAGSVSFSAKSYRCDTATWGANLDIHLELYDQFGALVASDNPAADTDAAITRTVPAGTYYLVLKPSAAGDPLSNLPSGYKSYGSLGQYSITGKFVPTDSIILTDPNGGELWAGGETREIRWVSAMGGNVKIELFKGGAFDSTIIDNAPNNGSYNWSIPSGQTPAGDYRIKITSVESPAKSDVSASDFTISPVALPEISIEQPVGSELVDGTSLVDFGNSLIGTSVSVQLTIRNTGTAELNGLAVNKSGPHSADFEVSALDVAKLKPGDSTIVSLVFTPSGLGVRNASLQIASNDEDENPFDIDLVGTGVAPPAPDITVEQPLGTALTSDISTVDFGNVNIGEPVPLTFRIRNDGNASMSGLSLSKAGSAAADFLPSSLPFTNLAPGREMTFTVTFSPSIAGKRLASLLITSNDPDENPFTISLFGNGTVPVVPDIVVEDEEGEELSDGDPMNGFGFVELGFSVTRTFKIRNSGIADLTGLAATLGGSHSSDFGDLVIGSTTLAPGAETTLKITFTPKEAGTRYAKLQIASNDPNENPFDIDLIGYGKILPFIEIAVEHPAGTNLVDGISVLDFGNTGTGSSMVKTVTIRNIGTVDLNGLAVTRSGPEAADFAIGALGTNLLAPGASTSFNVTFTPNAVGKRSASIQIASNDADENPFDITLGGTGFVLLVPEIVVEEPAGTNLADGMASLEFGNANIGASVAKSITIRNSGTSDLKDLVVTHTGANTADFVIGPLGSTSLAPGSTTTFMVSFTPRAAGFRIVELQISSNDADENPFDITLGGTGVVPPAPEIMVLGPAGANLLDGKAVLSFGTANIGSPIAKSITIRNSGTADLTGLAVTRGGTNAADFALGSLGATSLAPGASTTFTVTFMPTAAGALSAALQIVSNDADENPFDIALGGTAVIPPMPEIVVEEPAGTNLVDGAVVLSFGSANIGAPVAKTVTIRNTGTANLTGLAVTSGGTNAADFALGGLGSTSLAPGARTTFTVTFTPAAAGTRSAKIQISSNDTDENPFDIALNGTGVVPPTPEIVVHQGKGANKNLTDNKSSRNFGSVPVGMSSTVKVFTIRNVGNAPLEKLGLSLTGRQAKDFRIVKIPAKTLTPGNSSTFRIIFKPGKIRLSKATLRIASNDGDENPFRVELLGKGVK